MIREALEPVDRDVDRAELSIGPAEHFPQSTATGVADKRYWPLRLASVAWTLAQ